MTERDRYDPLILVIDNFFCKDGKSEQKVGAGEGDSYDEEAENHVWPEGEDKFHKFFAVISGQESGTFEGFEDVLRIIEDEDEFGECAKDLGPNKEKDSEQGSECRD